MFYTNDYLEMPSPGVRMSGADVACLVYLFTSNRRRDRVYGPADKEASGEAGMRDLTEFENKDFRYVY